ncbi:hypothetical protein LCGC14_1240270 [marine sediment metagenome]|uniref:Uncharacterized protein n=1 Tax=marine sediment metagenome TaxID=412755 RepID=A0A0F9PAA0_9ZZZZ
MKVMFELIAAIFRALLPKEEPPAPEPTTPPRDEDEAYHGHSLAADEETTLEVLTEAVLDLYRKTARDNDPPEQMLYAFSMGVRITLADPGLGRGIQQAMMLPKFKDGLGVAMMDQAAAELRQMIESRER